MGRPLPAHISLASRRRRTEKKGGIVGSNKFAGSSSKESGRSPFRHKSCRLNRCRKHRGSLTEVGKGGGRQC